jgi:Family of unknown function (DUF6049)
VSPSQTAPAAPGKPGRRPGPHSGATPGRRGVVLGLLGAVLALVGTALPARAQQSGTPSGPGAELILQAISPVTGPKTPLAYRLAVRNTGSTQLRNLRVRGSIGGAIGTRSELQRLAEDPDNEPAGLDPVQSWQPGDGSAVVAPGATLGLPVHSEPLPTWLRIRSPGMVLPLVLQVSASSDLGPVSSHLTTFVVATDGRIRNPLRVSLLVPFHEQTHRNAAGDFVDNRLSNLLAADGSLGAMAAELARPDAPKVTMMVDPLLTDEATVMAGSWKLKRGHNLETVSAGDQRSLAAKKFVQDLLAAAGRNLPSALPYANADLPSLVRAGSDAEALAPLLYARKHLKEWLGPDPDSSLAWPAPGAIDAATLKVLAEAEADSVVLDSHLLPTSAATTQNATVDLGGGLGGLEHALVPDPALSVALADPMGHSEPAQWTQRVLAETAVTWLELPNGAARGILLAPPQNWRPAPEFFRPLVRGLAGVPWLSLVPAQELANQVAQGPDKGDRPLVPYTQADVSLGLPGSYLRNIATVNSRLTSFSRMVGADFPALDDYDRDLLIAQSSDWRTPAGRAKGASFARAVSQGMHAVQRLVGVQRTRVTLTSRKGAIPITVTNAGPQRLTVVLRLSSPRVDLPSTSEPFTINPKEQVTRRVEVGTRATGTFPIRVDVFTPDGQVNIARDQVTLVSTAFNRVALILAGGAAGFLLLWWGRKTGWRRRGVDTPTRPADGAS